MIIIFKPNGETEEIIDIKQVRLEEAAQIIETCEPRGLFYTRDATTYKWMGINNSNGEAFVGKSSDLGLMVRWLRCEIDIQDLENEGED